jgi:sirohydrochlorin ferrochelatase
MRAIAAAVGRQWPAPVVAAFLDFNVPSIPDALQALAAARAGTRPIVVPALLTNAYHKRVDLQGILSATPHPTTVADVLGPDPLLVAALRRRLSEMDAWAQRPDGLVLIAAGTSDAQARSTVDDVAAELGRQLGVPCLAGYASASPPTGGDAVTALRAAGARRILVASYFLAPGRLYDLAAASALAAGAVAVSAPLGTAEELVRLIVARSCATGRCGGEQAVVGPRGERRGGTVPELRMPQSVV